jgi:ubiquinone/menaquinone biosynthesis C-methylase UbiE
MAASDKAKMDADTKSQVREFYDSVGWKKIGEGLYQNAKYEDLRPVSQEYIHRCHMRVTRHLPNRGDLFLDAGSGPIQYPEYLEYSKGFHRRVCLDISILALKEGRERIGDHGLFVVGDIANLPFVSESFDGVLSMHAIHHLEEKEHQKAYSELSRVSGEKSRMVVVSSWGHRSILMRLMRIPIGLMTSFIHLYRRFSGMKLDPIANIENPNAEASTLIKSPGTFTQQHGYKWVVTELSFLPGLDVVVWRSVSTSFLRSLIHRRLYGEFILDLLYRLEEFAPHSIGRVGQHPMILSQKNDSHHERKGEK